MHVSGIYGCNIHTLISMPAGVLGTACCQSRIEHSKSHWSLVMVGSWWKIILHKLSPGYFLNCVSKLRSILAPSQQKSVPVCVHIELSQQCIDAWYALCHAGMDLRISGGGITYTEGYNMGGLQHILYTVAISGGIIG